MKLVPEDKEFKFKGLCPYCGGDRFVYEQWHLYALSN